METLRLVALPGNGQSVVQPKALAADRDACPPDSAASDRDRTCQAAISIGGRRSTGDRRSPAVYRLLVDRGDLAACDRCALVPSRWPSDDRQLCVGTGLHDDRYRHLESIRLERLASGAVRLKAHRGRARDPQRRITGYDHLLHPRRQQAYDIVQTLYGANHGFGERNDQRDRGLERGYRQPCDLSRLHHRSTLESWPKILGRQFPLKSYNRNRDPKARLPSAGPSCSSRK
jgi:hypothetical protein